MDDAIPPEEVSRLDRIARMDGYRVRAAADKRQEMAWMGRLGVFRGNGLMFSANRADRVRGWLYSQVR